MPARRETIRLQVTGLLFALSLLGASCKDKEASFFAPTRLSEAPTGTIEVTVRADGQLFQGTVSVTVSGEVHRNEMVTGGSASFSDLPPGNYSVTLTPPPAHECVEPSKSVALPAGETRAVEFDCTRTVPTGDEIAEKRYDLRATVTASTCGGINTGDLQNEDDFGMEFDPATSVLTAHFEATSSSGPYDPATGSWTPPGEFVSPEGITFREMLTGSWTFVDEMPQFSGTSDVRVWLPDQDPDTEAPFCTFSRDVMFLARG